MKRALAVIAVLAVLAAGWFLVHDEGGRKAVPHMFNNMNERPLTDAQHVEAASTPAGRKVRLLPPRAVAQSLGGAYTARDRDVRDVFAGEGSYFFFRPPAGRG